MMTNAEGSAFLASTGWLARTAPAFREEMIRRFVWRRMEEGATIGFAGDEVGGVFGIASGQIAITSGVTAPDSPIADVMIAGTWGGYSPLFGVARLADSRTMMPSLIATVPLAAQRAMLASNPGWWEDMGQMAMEISLRYGAGMADLLIRDSARRCLAVLLRFGGLRLSGDAPVSILLSQDALAAGANMSRHTAGETLRTAEALGLLALGYRQMTILQPAALRAMVDAG